MPVKENVIRDRLLISGNGVYCNQEQVSDAFNLAERKYGGKLHLFHLRNLNRDANRLKRKKHYDAEIYYMLK